MAIRTLVMLIDGAGRKLEARADLNRDYVAVPVGPIGVVLFEKTSQTTALGGLVIYRQVGSPIDVKIAES